MLTWLPENISTLGVGVDHLFTLIYSITVAIFVIVNAIYVAFIIKYRRRKATDKAYYHHGNNSLEFAWTALPFALFLFLALYSDQIWRDMRYASRAPKPDITVEVMGQQFMWHVRYPGSDGIFGHREAKFNSPSNPFGVDPSDPNGLDDYTAINQLHLPINKTVLVRLSSVDVIHSFFVPNMRIKQDAVPGQWVDVWFNGRKTGEYEIACAELCGSGHYLMRAVLTYHAQKDFDAWLDQQYGAAAAARETAADTPAAPVTAQSVAAGH
jgi:cytochrome c oxidase subunit II